MSVLLKRGIEIGSRPELVGGGLIRSLGGWSQVLSLSNCKVITHWFKAVGLIA